MTLRYYIPPQGIECMDCKGVINRIFEVRAVVNEDRLEMHARCDGCGNTGIISFPIHTARPLPEEPPK